MIATLVDIMTLVDDYTSYLEEKGCVFDAEGFPILNRDCFLDEWPDLVIPFRNRNSKIVKSPEKTVLCLYCGDDRIYPRLEKVLEEISEYRRFMGAVSADVTVTADMDIEWQQETMLLNQLFMAVLAIHGIKVALNLRSGSAESLSCFDSIPPDVMCASGTLGCAATASYLDMRYIAKLMRVRPAKVLLYGKSDPILEDQLGLAGIPYRRYVDFHELSKRGQS